MLKPDFRYPTKRDFETDKNIYVLEGQYFARPKIVIEKWKVTNKSTKEVKMIQARSIFNRKNLISKVE